MWRWCWARERVGLLLLQLFPSGGATDIVFVTLFCITVGTAIAWCGVRCAMPDGHCRNILLFWRRSTAALVFGFAPVSRPCSSSPLPHWQFSVINLRFVWTLSKHSPLPHWYFSLINLRFVWMLSKHFHVPVSDSVAEVWSCCSLMFLFL